MIRRLLVAFLVLVVVLIGVILTRPATYHIERSTTIDAQAATVFPQVNDFNNWEAWSPWAKLDPNMTTELGGAASGTGATYHWVGNKEVGEGRMTITDSRPNEHVAIKLEFLKPWQSTSTTTFTMTPASSGTQVVWAMDGQNDFTGKAVSLFMNMDQMVGKDFEKGLAALKSISEGTASPDAEAPPDTPPSDGSSMPQ
jgi:hypothetical protein